ncbi:MAG: hypothetical protein U0610_07145 [bacterium]
MAERAAAGFERLRRASEAVLARTGERPRVLAAATDAGKRAKAKLGFAREVLEVAGLKVVTRDGLGDGAAIAAAYAEAAAQAVALSPADDLDGDRVVALLDAIGAALGAVPIALVGKVQAGATSHARIESLPRLHAGANLVEALASLERAMGVSS